MKPIELIFQQLKVGMKLYIPTQNKSTVRAPRAAPSVQPGRGQGHALLPERSESLPDARPEVLHIAWQINS